MGSGAEEGGTALDVTGELGMRKKVLSRSQAFDESELRGKGLSQMQAGIVTVLEAWRVYVPQSCEPPRPGHVCGWLQMGSLDEIIDLIEKSVGHRSPRHFVFCSLQNMRGSNHAN
jgi:hypothetical protein